MPDLPSATVPPVLQKKKRWKDSALYRVLVRSWYDRLDRAERDYVDQAGHFTLGFILGFFLPGWVSWAICHHREFVRQAPIQRIDDTERDMFFWQLGTIGGWFARWAAIFSYATHVIAHA